MFRLGQVAMNGVTCISPEIMLDGKGQNMTPNERKLWTLQNRKLKNGLAIELSIFQDKLDVLGTSCLYLINFLYVSTI